MTRSTIRLVGCCFHLDPVDFSRRLAALAAKSGHGLEGVIVCNAPGSRLDGAPTGIAVLEGTNETLDFSAYFEGLGTFGALVDGPVLFVNDSLFTKHDAKAVLGMVLALVPLVAQSHCAALAGVSHPYMTACLRNPWSGDGRYISSFCFLANRPACDILLRMQQWAIEDGLPPSPTAALSDDDWGMRLSPPFREMIRTHLVYDPSPYAWPRARARDGVELLAWKKARCVYFEHRLSGAIGIEGALLPVNAGPRAGLKLLLAEQRAAFFRKLRSSVRI